MDPAAAQLADQDRLREAMLPNQPPRFGIPQNLVFEVNAEPKGSKGRSPRAGRLLEERHFVTLELNRYAAHKMLVELAKYVASESGEVFSTILAGRLEELDE